MSKLLHSMPFKDMPEFSRLVLLFAIEGSLLQTSGSIAGFCNNLFATNLGATDSQIGLIQTVPNLAAVLLMLPVGMLSDRAKSSRTVPLVTLFVLTAGFVLMSLVPFFGGLQMIAFFTALPFIAGGPAMYNAQWQNFFGDVIQDSLRNRTLTQRNRFTFLCGMVAPVICGMFLGLADDPASKRIIFQVFYFICAAITLAQICAVSRIKAPVRTDASRGYSFREAGQTIVMLMKHKPFLGFFLPVVFFYMTWQMDWSMWFIMQTQYLHMTEMQLSIYNGVFNIGQLVAIGYMSKIVRKKGNDFTITIGALGLISCPLLMACSGLIPAGIRFPAFTALIAICNAPQCAVNLTLVQILLRILPEKNRGLSLSLFTLTTTLTNSFVPYLGVQYYTALGSNYRAFIIFNVTNCCLRIVAYCMLLGRYLILKRRGQLEPGIS